MIVSDDGGVAAAAAHDDVDRLADEVADVLFSKGLILCNGDRGEAAAFAWGIAQTAETKLYERAMKYPQFADAMRRARVLAEQDQPS